MLLILAGWSTTPTRVSCAASLPVICIFSDALLPGLLDDPKNFSLYWISRLVNRKTYYYRHPSTISIASGKRQLIRAANWRDRQSPLCTLLPPAFSFLGTKERRGHNLEVPACPVRRRTSAAAGLAETILYCWGQQVLLKSLWTQYLRMLKLYLSDEVKNRMYLLVSLETLPPTISLYLTSAVSS